MPAGSAWQQVVAFRGSVLTASQSAQCTTKPLISPNHYPGSRATVRLDIPIWLRFLMADYTLLSVQKHVLGRTQLQHKPLCRMLLASHCNCVVHILRQAICPQLSVLPPTPTYTVREHLCSSPSFNLASHQPQTDETPNFKNQAACRSELDLPYWREVHCRCAPGSPGPSGRTSCTPRDWAPCARGRPRPLA